VLQVLAKLCLKESPIDKKEVLLVNEKIDPKQAKYPVSIEKLWRMHKNVVENGFTSYAEA